MSEEGAEVHIVEEAEDEDAPSTRLWSSATDATTLDITNMSV